MNRSDFLNMIGDSVPFNRQMIGEVYELIDIFPYFQSAHLLLLKVYTAMRMLNSKISSGLLQFMLETGKYYTGFLNRECF